MHKKYYYIRLYFTVFLLARSNTRDIPFSLEMPVPSQGHYGFHSFPVVD